MSTREPLRFARTLEAGISSPPPPRSPRLMRGRVDLVELADVVIAFLCVVLTASTLDSQDQVHGNPYSHITLLFFAVIVSLPLVLRTRFPALAWGASSVALAVTATVIGPGTLSSAVYLPAGVLVYGLCLYAVAVRCRTWFAVSAGLVTLAGAIVIDSRTAIGAVLAAIPLLAGAYVRSRRSSRVELAQQARQHQGERALLEERQRIAREMHDIVAHHMSVIAIQAEAGPRKVTDPPPELVESFRDIRASALDGLTELRRLLGVLRTGTPDTTPQPGLGQLSGLLDSARNAGVPVSLSVSGVPRELPQGMDLSAYRIMQEALSNAMRHAPGCAVRVEVAYFPSSVVIKVRNGLDGDAPAVSGNGSPAAAGHGIIGMRERAAMLGGQLEAGPTDEGGFLVTAVLPDTKPDTKEPVEDPR
ncbi:MAG TPA: sensor histidine kinase [Streptosporangiaceae bacterium]|nr:sensor histidine kinase [Streptosporangiaceae bacterium]